MAQRKTFLAAMNKVTNNQVTNYETIIGLEIHVEPKTVSKMFCTSPAEHFGEKPNTHTCPICLGLPGALPQTNRKALESCIKVGLALNCEISKTSRFERKNYFYPDLPKGYQISQYRWPLCTNGWIEVTGKDKEEKRIRINRVHQEEDTAKLAHLRTTNGEPSTTLVDFNRSGVPLIEIVTEPDFRGTEEIRDYAKKLQQILRYLNVSNADMEKGEMRLEANVSVRKLSTNSEQPTTNDLPPYRVELKNINSFRFMVAAVEYEVARQIKAHEKGEKLVQETRGWDEEKKQTYVQRVKEEANDYRYFPDPDLPQFDVDNSWISTLKNEMPELPNAKIARFVAQYQIGLEAAVVLSDTEEFASYFEEAVRVGSQHGVSPSKIANILVNKKFDRDKILPADLIIMIQKDVNKPTLPEEELEGIVKEVIDRNPKAAEDFKSGKEVALRFLLGQVLGKTKGQADPKEATEKLIDFLQNTEVK